MFFYTPASSIIYIITSQSAVESNIMRCVRVYGGSCPGVCVCVYLIPIITKIEQLARPNLNCLMRPHYIWAGELSYSLNSLYKLKMPCKQSRRIKNDFFMQNKFVILKLCFAMALKTSVFGLQLLGSVWCSSVWFEWEVNFSIAFAKWTFS